MPDHFELLEHTADIGIRAHGYTRDNLFLQAAIAVQAVALDAAAVEPRAMYPLEATGEDRDSLMVNWLNEVIYHLDGARVAFHHFVITQMADTFITAEGWGEPRDAERHPVRLAVKAATYHQLRITQSGDRWQAEIYLDI